MHDQGSENRWKIAITVLVAFFVCALIATMVLAARKVKVLDKDYYRQGMNYGERSKTAEKSSGWKIVSSLKNEILSLYVINSQGIPVTGAEAGFVPRHISGKVAQSVTLVEFEPGRYQAPVALEYGKEVRGTITIKRGDAAISAKVALFR